MLFKTLLFLEHAKSINAVFQLVCKNQKRKTYFFPFWDAKDFLPEGLYLLPQDLKF